MLQFPESYFNNFNKNIGLWIVCMTNVTQLPAVWSASSFTGNTTVQDSFLKPYAAPSVKQLELYFHWAQKYFIKMYYGL